MPAFYQYGYLYTSRMKVETTSGSSEWSAPYTCYGSTHNSLSLPFSFFQNNPFPMNYLNFSQGCQLSNFSAPIQWSASPFKTSVILLCFLEFNNINTNWTFVWKYSLSNSTSASDYVFYSTTKEPYTELPIPSTTPIAKLIVEATSPSGLFYYFTSTLSFNQFRMYIGSVPITSVEPSVRIRTIFPRMVLLNIVSPIIVIILLEC